LLAFVAEGFERTFRPEWAAGACGTVRFEVAMSDRVCELCIAVDETACRIVSELDDPDAEVTIPLPVLVRIAFKQLTGGEAYVDGLVTASGDVVLATSLDSWFADPTEVS